MKFTTHNGRQVAYTAEGRGEPVVLLHGFCEDSYVWEDFRQDLLEEQQYRVVCIDLPGFGRSDAGPASVEDYAMAVEAVCEELHLERIVLIGHSMGGYVALAVAERQPQRLRGMGLFHSHPYADSAEKRESRFKSIEFIERQGHQVFVKQLIPRLFAPRFVASHPFVIDKLVFRASRYPRDGIINGLRAMADRPDRSGVLAGLPCPALFINGMLDEAIPPEARQDQLALPGIGSIHGYDKVAHMGMMEAARPTQLAVRQFVDFCQRWE